MLSATLLLAGLLNGCGGDGVEVRAYEITDAGREACAAVIEALPAEVAGKARRTIDGNRFAVAWGDPAIILRCGVGIPEGFDRFSTCQRAEGVDWFVPESVIADQRVDVLMTTVGRSPAVDVLVPARYRPTLGPMVDLAPALKAATTVTTPCQ